jgi:hypothetical protein
VPRRTNLFQEVVALLHAHLAGGAEVEESAMLCNRVTREAREVDVVIRSTVAGQRFVIGVEATMRKGSSPWVEEMIGKHADLPTDRLVLVAERGFSRPALRYAAQKGVATITPTTIAGDEPAARLIAALQRLWPKGVSLTPTTCRMCVRKPDGEIVRAVDLHDDTIVFSEDGREITTVGAMFKKLVDEQFPRLMEQIGLADITEDRDEYFVLRAGEEGAPPRYRHRGRAEGLYLRWDDAVPPELHQILVAEYTGRAVIAVAEVEMTFRRFAASVVGHGATRLGNAEALVVVTETEGSLTTSIRLREAESDTTMDGTDQGQGGYAEQ